MKPTDIASVVTNSLISTIFHVCLIHRFTPFCFRRMGFIMEFAENLILRMMEDPKERDRKFRERLYDRKDRCQKTKEMWSLPLRPYGFWTFERHNAQIFWDSQISQVPGRRDPYDDLIQEASSSSSSK